MMRRLVVVGVIVVSLVAVAVPASAKTVAPGAWASKFCTDLQSWNAKLNSDVGQGARGGTTPAVVSFGELLQGAARGQ